MLRLLTGKIYVFLVCFHPLKLTHCLYQLVFLISLPEKKTEIRLQLGRIKQVCFVFDSHYLYNQKNIMETSMLFLHLNLFLYIFSISTVKNIQSIPLSLPTAFILPYIEMGYIITSATIILYIVCRLSKVQKRLKAEKQKNTETTKIIMEKEWKIHQLHTQYLLNKKIVDSSQKQVTMINESNSSKQSTNQEITFTIHTSIEDKFKESNIFSLFLTENARIKDENWEELFTWIDILHPHFLSHVRHLHPTISTLELRITCLVKIGIPIHKIAGIFNLTSQAISHSRSRLYKKMTGKEGKTKDFDSLIANL